MGQWLATERRVASSTLNQAHAAMLFLYRDVLREPARCPAAIPRARRHAGPPDVLAPEEASRLLAAVAVAHRLAVSLLYGAALRLKDGAYDLYSMPVDEYQSHMTDSRSSGGEGRVGIVTRKAFTEYGKRLRIVRIPSV